MAHKKGQGSTSNGRDSRPKYMGIKAYAGEHVTVGSIIVRQNGTKFKPGKNVGLARNDSLFALAEGTVKVVNYKISVEPKAAKYAASVFELTAETEKKLMKPSADHRGFFYAWRVLTREFRIHYDPGMLSATKHKLWAGVPAGIVLLAAGGLWVFINGGRWAPANAGTLAGFLMVLLVMGTVGGIITTAATIRPIWPLMWLAVVVALLILATSANALGFMPCLALCALFVAWMALWCGVSRERWLGPGVSTGVPLALSALCMASPVVLMPLVRWAAHWTVPAPSPWQGRVVEVIRHGCPLFAVLDVMPPSLRSNWATLPGMYKWSGLGQEVPMTLPNVWVCVAIYAGPAVILWLPALWPRRPHRE